MRSVLFLAIGLLAASLDAFNCQQEQTLQRQQVGARILRRVIKSTPSATNLTRVRLVTVRSSGAGERGAVSEISSKEAANFGQRSFNETVTPASAASVAAQQQAQPSVKSARPATSTTSTSTTSTTPASASSPTPNVSTTAASAPSAGSSPVKASERQLAAAHEPAVDLMASAPSSWQLMTAVEAPATAALIAAGTRPAAADLMSASSSSVEESSLSATNDFLRSSASTTKGSYTTTNTIGETFSRLRQGKTSQQQQSYFYPQQQRAASKTSSQQQASKTHWYQPSSTTPRPAPIVQQQQQQYEQQNEQYVEQQQHIEAAPPGQAEPFAFDFNTQDNSGNGQYRKEESDRNGVVRGSYGYTDANGIYRHVEYVADENGFRANIKSNEPGLIGETQPASIRLDGGSAPAVSAGPRFSTSNSQSESAANTAEWTAATNSERADLALAPPDFESSHKAERLRAPRHFRQ